MNRLHFSVAPKMRPALVTALIGALGITASAQTSPAPKPPSSSPPAVLSAHHDSAQLIAARAKAFADARTLARSGDIGGVERTISQTLMFSANSSRGHFETAKELDALAGDMAREAHRDAASALMKRALQHLQQADSLETDARTKGRINARIGSLQAGFFGDVPSAIASYQAALKADPGNKRAKQALAQLQEMDAILRARIKAATGK